MDNKHKQTPIRCGSGSNKGKEHFRSSPMGFSPSPGMFYLGTPDPTKADGLLSRVFQSPSSTVGFQGFKPVEISGGCRGNYFAPHWSEEVVKEAIEKGEAFKAVFRVNAFNRLEAYCTLDGIPVDILINGAAAQNRAVEGDTVAVVIDPVGSWSKSKGAFHDCSDPFPCNAFNQIGGLDGVNNANKDGLRTNTMNNGFPKNLISVGNGRSSLQKRVEGEVESSELQNGFGGPSVTSEVTKTCNSSEMTMNSAAVTKICVMLTSFPYKRPTGRVVSIIERSNRRNIVIGFLSVPDGSLSSEMHENRLCGQSFKKTNNLTSFHSMELEYVFFLPNDPKFPNMIIYLSSLPPKIRERLDTGDPTVKMELVSAEIIGWSEDNLLPEAGVIQVLGRGGDVEVQISAILIENAIWKSDFTFEALQTIPDVPWEIPQDEIAQRKDLRRLCIFTIDPSSAIDLDDALSVQMLCDGTYRVGIHISDVSYFVHPNTVLDTEVQHRSTSVYILQHKFSMLPARLSEDLASLIPGVDRLAFSIIFDINSDGDIVDHWMGHTVIRSCCKLSYECAQSMIDGSLYYDQLNASQSELPILHGEFEWDDIVCSVKILHQISKRLKVSRLKDGALWLDSAKLAFMFDECGTPYDSILYERKDSNFLVEELMLLANKTVAEVISRVFPECSLLRRHPEPNLRKLKDFRSFWMKQGFQLDVSSSAQLHISLSRIQEILKDDPVLFDIIVSYASKPMQLAAYFCTGDLANKVDEWAHYSLAVPRYTHFTSPLRRYPDIVVHRTISAVLEAEEMYLQHKNMMFGVDTEAKFMARCFTGLNFDRGAFESKQGREALSISAEKYGVPSAVVLSEITTYCNQRKLASGRAEEAGVKVHLWALLRKKKILTTESRVMGLGPRFMSVYIHKLGIERRIHYGEIEGIVVDWLEATSTLVLDLLRSKPSLKRGGTARFYPLDDFALMINPSELSEDEYTDTVKEDSPSACSDSQGTFGCDRTDPTFFPISLRVLSSVPVALHAVGGDDGPIDIGARLYVASYFK